MHQLCRTYTPSLTFYCALSLIASWVDETELFRSWIMGCTEHQGTQILRERWGVTKRQHSLKAKHSSADWLKAQKNVPVQKYSLGYITKDNWDLKFQNIWQLYSHARIRITKRKKKEQRKRMSKVYVCTYNSDRK